MLFLSAPLLLHLESPNLHKTHQTLKEEKSNIMPTLTSRDMLGMGNTASSSPPAISTATIAIIVCVGIVPVFIVAGVVIWLLGFYGRECCPCRRRREKAQTPNSDSSSGTGSMTTSKEVLLQTFPSRPKPEPLAKMDSFTSGSGGEGVVQETRVIV